MAFGLDHFPCWFDEVILIVMMGVMIAYVVMYFYIPEDSSDRCCVGGMEYPYGEGLNGFLRNFSRGYLICVVFDFFFKSIISHEID